MLVHWENIILDEIPGRAFGGGGTEDEPAACCLIGSTKLFSIGDSDTVKGDSITV